MQGYTGSALKVLESSSVEIGDRIKVINEDKSYEGTLMPRTGLGDSRNIVIKLDSGYNLGVKINENTHIKRLGKGRQPRVRKPSIKFKSSKEKPDVTIIGTGGTIASRIDYRTGAVHPAFSTREIYESIPELSDIANIRTIVASNVLSENMSPELWIQIAKKTIKELNKGADGVVIAHGTDTMGYTSAALSFMLKNLTKPVVLVGSQRSSDRPSSDAALNLISAVTVARSDLTGVYVVMHGSTEDDFCLIHPGTRVRKCHTSRRDAFQTIDEIPIGRVRDGEIDFFKEVKGRSEGRVKLDSSLEEKVALIKTYPNIQNHVIEDLLNHNYKGIVIEGTGLGHVPKSLYPGIKKAINLKVPVVITSQCIWGRVNMNVYSTGRDLLRMGVIPCEDMIPETAYVKLMWILGHEEKFDKVNEKMRDEISGEINHRSRPDVFLKSNFIEGGKDE